MRYNKKAKTFVCDVQHLDDEIIKSQNEKKRIVNELPLLKMIYDKAKREYESKINRIKVIDDFIYTATNKINENERKEDQSCQN